MEGAGKVGFATGIPLCFGLPQLNVIKILFIC